MPVVNPSRVATVAVLAHVRRSFVCRTCGVSMAGDRIVIEVPAGPLARVEQLIERKAAAHGNGDMPVGWSSYHLPTGFAYVCAACPHP